MLSAQDSLRVYADTFRLHEQDNIVNDDLWLLEMLAQQSEQIFVRDSIARDSLILQLEEQQLQLELATQYLQDSLMLIRDSILRLKEQQLVRVPKHEPIDSTQLYFDSISRVLARVQKRPTLQLSSREVDNKQDDLEELEAAIWSKRTHWYKEGTIMAQFSQSYASPNWYNGGSPLAFALISTVKGRVSYINKNIAWENYFDWRNGISTTPGDSLRKYNVTDDLVRIYSKFGYQILKNLYLSSSADFQTTQWNLWKANKRELQSAFLTPIYFNLNIGLDWKPIEGLSVAVYPANYRLVYAYNSTKLGVDVTSYGIAAGKNIKNEIGSSIRVQWKKQIIREILIETEFYFYTNYKGVELDWEINTDFIINRFLSAHVMLRPRFDNTKHVAGEPKDRLQFKDLISMGFSHKFH